jgi:hypothetical protein
MEEYVGSQWAPRQPLPSEPEAKKEAIQNMEYIHQINSGHSTQAYSAASLQKPGKQPFFLKRWWLLWWRHYKRWWIWYGVGTVIFLAIFLPLL